MPARDEDKGTGVICKKTPVPFSFPGATSYLYDFNHLLQEMDGDDQTEKLYTFTDDQWGDLISEYGEEDGSLYHQYDAQWSTQALLDEDQSVTDRYKYRAFGLQDHAAGTSKAPHTFVGKQGYYRDSELDLYMLGMGNGDGLGGRFYDPALGRFVSEDPLRQDGGDENLYRYVKNNPINVIDPSGQEWNPLVFPPGEAIFERWYRSDRNEWGNLARRKVAGTPPSKNSHEIFYYGYESAWGSAETFVREELGGEDCRIKFSFRLGLVDFYDESSVRANRVLVRVPGKGPNFSGFIPLGTIKDEAWGPDSGAFDTRGYYTNEVLDNIHSWFAKKLGRSEEYANPWKKVTLLDGFLDVGQGVVKAVLGSACKQLELFTGQKGICDMFAQIGEVLGAIWDNPGKFIETLWTGVKDGVVGFFGQLPTLLGEAFRDLFGIPQDIQFAPENFNVQEIPKFAAKVVGATWERVEAALRNKIPKYDAIKQFLGVEDCTSPSFDFLGTLRCIIDHALSQAGQSLQNFTAQVQDYFKNISSHLKSVVTQIKDEILTKLVEQVGKKILSLLNPAFGVLIQIYDLVKHIYEHRREFAKAVMNLLGSIKDAAKDLIDGNPEGVANAVIKGLKTLLPRGIELGAALVGLMPIIKTARGIISKVLGLVQSVIEWFLDIVIQMFCKLPGLTKLVNKVVPGFCPGKKKDDGCDVKNNSKKKKPRGSCFVAGTRVHPLDGALLPITSIKMQARVVTLLSATGSSDSESTVDREASWATLRAILRYDENNYVEIGLLRTLAWMEDSGAKVGGSIFLNMPEMGVEGEAEVLSIEPCPPPGKRDGGLVTGTFRHNRAVVYDLKLTSESEPLGVTATHPFWSIDREDWISAIDLCVGERLETLSGTTQVERFNQRPAPEPVYNIEVEGDHVYRVGESGVLVHNASLPGTAVSPGVDYGCENPSGQGNCQRGNINSNIAGGVPSGYQGHHLIGVAEARIDIMVRACKLGYDINRRNNGIALPSSEAEATRTGLPLHRGRHRAVNYNDCVREHLRKLRRDYLADRVTDCNLCDKIKDIEDEIRRAVLAHELWLNPNDPHIRPGQTATCTA